MGKSLILARREFKAYFTSPLAYVYITLFLVIQNFIFFRGFFEYPVASMRSFFELLPWVFLFFIPAVTMRLWSEEKRLGTFELLMTLPVQSHEAVLGKFLGGLAFTAFALLLTVTIPITLGMLGSPDWGEMLGSYVGALLMGAGYLAIGCFFSSLTKSQVIAFVLSLAVTFTLLILGTDFILGALPASLRPWAYYLGLYSHFLALARGVVDTRDVLYYLSLIGLFLLLNVYKIEGRRWL